jgi:hypothetical protein
LQSCLVKPTGCAHVVALPAYCVRLIGAAKVVEIPHVVRVM